METEPEARPLPKLAPSLQRIVEAAGGDWPHEPVEIDQATCRKLSRWPGDLMTCWLEPLARGSAARLIIQTLCEADYCDWEAYLFADGSDEPLQPAPDELSRDHVLAYAEVGVFVGGEGLEESSKRLIVIERATRRQQPFADCFSPSVSPGGQWILCRDRRGAVLAVPVEGGEPQPVVVPQIDPALVLWQPRFWAVVSKVRFPDPKHMKYKIDLMPELPPKVERHRERIEGPFVIEWQE